MAPTLRLPRWKDPALQYMLTHGLVEVTPGGHVVERPPQISIPTPKMSLMQAKPKSMSQASSVAGGSHTYMQPKSKSMPRSCSISLPSSSVSHSATSSYLASSSSIMLPTSSTMAHSSHKTPSTSGKKRQNQQMRNMMKELHTYKKMKETGGRRAPPTYHNKRGNKMKA